MEDRLAIHGVRMLYPLAEITCTKVETVDVGGPGLVKTGGGVIGGSFGPVGAAEGIAVAAIFNALTTRRSTKTMVRVQPATAELLFLYTRTEPGALRIDVSRSHGD